MGRKFSNSGYLESPKKIQNGPPAALDFTETAVFNNTAMQYIDALPTFVVMKKISKDISLEI